MLLETQTIVTTDPVKEYEVTKKYKESLEWRCMANATNACCFVKSSGVIQVDTPFFMDNKDGGDDG